ALSCKGYHHPITRTLHGVIGDATHVAEPQALRFDGTKLEGAGLPRARRQGNRGHRHDNAGGENRWFRPESFECPGLWAIDRHRQTSDRCICAYVGAYTRMSAASTDGADRVLESGQQSQNAAIADKRRIQLIPTFGACRDDWADPVQTIPSNP